MSKIFFSAVCPIVRAFHLLYQFLCPASLSLPFLLPHLEIAVEQLVVRHAVAASDPIPECEELAVIVIEVEMMQSMAGRAIDDRGSSRVFAVICASQCPPCGDGGRETYGSRRSR